MSYKELYSNDKDYQKIINDFKAAKSELEKKAKQRVYKFSLLAEEAQDILDDLQASIKAHHATRLEETKQAMRKLEERDTHVGYADRPNEAKEFEMQYKLASEKDLELMVHDLNTDDLLEINLLRMELKIRGMEDQEKLVKRYVIQNNIGGMDEAQQKEYEAKKKDFATYSTVGGTRNIILDGELRSLDNIEKEIMSIPKQTEAV